MNPILTFLSSINRAIFGHKEYLLQEAENDDSKDPELEPHQVLVRAAHGHRPDHTHHTIHWDHHTVEL